MIPSGRTAARLDVGRESARRRAGVLLIITSVLWLHQWLPALSVVAFLVWIFLHNRLEGELGADLLHAWRRGWPPAIMVVVPLLVIGTIAYSISALPIDRKILPIALNLLALSLIVGGEWRWPSEPVPGPT